MLKQKPVREKGKIRLSEYFKNLKEGDRVAIVRELAIQDNIPRSIQGKTGVVGGKRGRAYVIKIKDGKKEKRYIVKAIHLKKIKT